ncbi:hypothetical protein D3C86_2015060 [compost metagenome]
MPDAILNSSPIMCETEPLPADAYVSLPGSLLASLMKSAMFLALTFGLMVMMLGTAARLEMGVKSFSPSNGRFG